MPLKEKAVDDLKSPAGSAAENLRLRVEVGFGRLALSVPFWNSVLRLTDFGSRNLSSGLSLHFENCWSFGFDLSFADYGFAGSRIVGLLVFAFDLIGKDWPCP